MNNTGYYYVQLTGLLLCITACNGDGTPLPAKKDGLPTKQQQEPITQQPLPWQPIDNAPPAQQPKQTPRATIASLMNAGDTKQAIASATAVLAQAPDKGTDVLTEIFQQYRFTSRSRQERRDVEHIVASIVKASTVNEALLQVLQGNLSKADYAAGAGLAAALQKAPQHFSAVEQQFLTEKVNRSEEKGCCAHTLPVWSRIAIAFHNNDKIFTTAVQHLGNTGAAQAVQRAQELSKLFIELPTEQDKTAFIDKLTTVLRTTKEGDVFQEKYRKTLEAYGVLEHLVQNATMALQVNGDNKALKAACKHIIKKINQEALAGLQKSTPLHNAKEKLSETAKLMALCPLAALGEILACSSPEESNALMTDKHNSRDADTILLSILQEVCDKELLRKAEKYRLQVLHP